MKPKEWIALKPKWHPKTGDFFGYDQTDGTHFYDKAGKVVEFVPIKLYKELERVLRSTQKSEHRYFKANVRQILEIAELKQKLKKASA
jgi:hypothetical protein